MISHVRRLLLGFAFAVLAFAPPAAASTVGLAPDPLTSESMVLYRASAGEANQASAGTPQADAVQLDELATGGVVIQPDAPCVPGPVGQPGDEPGGSATCPSAGVDLITAVLADQDDRFSGATDFTLPLAVSGGSGDDALSGGAADDALAGDAGSDELDGGPGSDVLDGGPGADKMTGGDSPGDPATIDVADYSARTAPVTVTLDGRADDGEAGEGDDVMPDIEEVDGGAGADVLVGNSVANRLFGGDGDDVIDGGPGADRLAGDGGDDTLQARDGVPDDVRCGDGDDTAIVDASDSVAPDCETVQRPTPAASPAPAPAPAAWSVPPDRIAPAVSVTLPKRRSLRALRIRGLRIAVAASEPAAVRAELRLSRAAARRVGLRPARVVIGRGAAVLPAAGRGSLTVRPTARARRALRRLRTARLTLRLTATDRAGNATTLTKAIRLRNG